MAQNAGIITNSDGSKNDAVPTIIDSLLAQGKISSRVLGIGLTPATSIGNGPMSSQPGTGTLTIGGVNPSDFIGQIKCAVRTIIESAEVADMLG